MSPQARPFFDVENGPSKNWNLESVLILLFFHEAPKKINKIGPFFGNGNKFPKGEPTKKLHFWSNVGGPLSDNFILNDF